MKKSNFYIYIYVRNKNISGKRLVSGYVDNDNSVGYHKEGNGKLTSWVSTDLCTGLKIVTSDTRTYCTKETEKVWNKVLSVRNRTDYEHLITRFRNAKDLDAGM